jgi:hypothetical protein
MLGGYEDGEWDYEDGEWDYDWGGYRDGMVRDAGLGVPVRASI